MARKKDSQQIREFLRQRLDAGHTANLQWTNKETFEFRLAWKDQKDHDWNKIEDPKLFEEWAINKEKDPKSNLAELKATFRAALKSTPYLKILEEGKNLKYKICKLIYPEGKENQVVSSRRKTHKSGHDHEVVCNGGHNLPLIVQNLSTTCASTDDADAPLSMNIEDFFDESMEIEISDEAFQLLTEQFEMDDAFMEQIIGKEYEDGLVQELGPGNMASGYTQPPQQLLPGQCQQQNKSRFEPITLPSDLTTGHYSKIDFRKAERPNDKIQLEVDDIFMIIKHRRHVLNRCHIAGCEKGFRISCSRPGDSDKHQEQYGSEVVIPALPPATELDDDFLKFARTLLEYINIHIYADKDGNIHARNLNKFHIFYANGLVKHQAVPKKLSREHHDIVFNCQLFRQAFEDWIENKGPKPDIRVLFSFGEEWNILTKPLEKCSVWVTLVSARLLFQMKQFRFIPRSIDSYNSTINSEVFEQSVAVEKFRMMKV